ncbi:MAG: 4-hydroxythreonine-4-phosphate dehydrogenase PdxA [Bacteroidales bacterium]|nr:MAG: 4-hydroxythreonine-4-phosphate dehydrogenase PdxA [Bacteroidales bacterium]
MNNRIKIGITHGDINSISYEIILKALSDSRLAELCTIIIYGSPKALAFYKKQLDMNKINIPTIRSVEDAKLEKSYILNCCAEDVNVEMGKQTLEAGSIALEALEMATQDLKEGKIDALVTAPINKNTIQSDKFQFSGHTEYFENRTDGKSIMMLISDNVRVALATNHTPVKQISESLSKQLIVDKLMMLNQSLKKDFTVTCPRIAVLGLNPHSSDNGLLGNEENDIITPAIEEATSKGVMCFGPLSADGFWGSGAFAKYDAILAMYHDQGLTPFKTLFQETGVNFTAGLNIVRTSPAHGTAYDLVGKNEANCQSLLNAIYMAIDIVRARKMHNEINANPLKVESYHRPKHYISE